MSSIFVGMSTDQMRGMMETVDSQVESKLESVMAEAIEKAKKTERFPRDPNDLYFIAGEIALTAFKNLEDWAAQTFTASPSKETAAAWVKASFYHFEGPKSIQQEIRQILSK